jgi:hypothetical protein
MGIMEISDYEGGLGCIAVTWLWIGCVVLECLASLGWVFGEGWLVSQRVCMSLCG